MRAMSFLRDIHGLVPEEYNSIIDFFTLINTDDGTGMERLKPFIVDYLLLVDTVFKSLSDQNFDDSNDEERTDI